MENQTCSQDFVNLPQVRDYLNLKDADEIARLVAAMAPRSMEFDAGALVDAAIAIQAEAEDKLRKHRTVLVSDMNLPTLWRIVEDVRFSGVLAKAYAYVQDCDDKEPMVLDPVLSPVLRRLRQCHDDPAMQPSCMIRAEEEEREIAIQTDLDEALTKAAERTKLQPPIMPCSLEEALRYVADAPDVDGELIRNAFKGFLIIDTTDIHIELDYFQRDCENLFCYQEKLENVALDSADRENLECLCEGIKQRIDVQNAVWNFRATWVPGQEVPDVIEKAGDGPLGTVFHNLSRLDDDGMYKVFVSDFYDFWKKYESTYMKMHAESERAKEDKIKISSVAGAKGAEIRERKKWTACTRFFIESPAFKEFVRKRKKQKSAEGIDDLVKSFAGDYGQMEISQEESKVKPSFDNILSFIGTTCTAAINNKKIDFILEKISSKKGFKKLTAEAISECLTMLKNALDIDGISEKSPPAGK